MATTITDATFTSTITDSVSLNNKAYGNTNDNLISSCNDAYERVFHIPAAVASASIGATGNFIPILTATAAPDTSGDIRMSDMEYARFTNLDNEYPIWIQLTNNNGVCDDAASTHAFTIKLDAGTSFILPSSQWMTGTSNIGNGVILTDGGKDEVGVRSSWTVWAVAHTATCDLEMFVVTK